MHRERETPHRSRCVIRTESLPVRALLGRRLVFPLFLAAASSAEARAQQSDVSIGPFVSYFPSISTSPLAGLALTLANGPLALRASGHLSLEDPNSSTTSSSSRPWGADADALLVLGGYGRRILAPYVFAGIGTSVTETDGFRDEERGWSYGAGLSVPLGSVLDIWGETRRRMSQFVLPTAYDAPTPRQELRFGISFHVGRSGGSPSRNRASDDSRISVIPAGIPVSIPSTSSTGTAARVLPTADRYVGVKYRWGGTSPSGGFDCSGFTQYVFAKHGVELPRTSRQQANVGMPMPADWRALSAGDLVMFEEGGRIGHVAIYAGRNRIIHSSSSGGGVRYDDLSTRRGRWFAEHMVAARRVTPDSRGLLLDLAKAFAGAAVELDPPDKAPRP
jgi:cell wall-associated NlpC family hydrolase